MTIFGWLTPTGRFVECDAYHHALAAMADPELRSLVSDIDEIEGEVTATEESCQAAEDAGEHGEWHWYEMAQSDANSKVWYRLIAAYCVRIGTAYKHNTICVEGLPEALKQQHLRILKLAEERDIEWEPQKLPEQGPPKPDPILIPDSAYTGTLGWLQS